MKVVMSKTEKKELKKYFESQGYKVTYKFIDKWLDDISFYKFSHYYELFEEYLNQNL